MSYCNLFTELDPVERRMLETEYNQNSSVDGAHPDVLPPDDAEQFCSHFRLPAFPPDRIKTYKVYDLLHSNTKIELLER